MVKMNEKFVVVMFDNYAQIKLEKEFNYEQGAFNYAQLIKSKNMAVKIIKTTTYII